MGRDTSLPKQSLGVKRLGPPIELLFGTEAQYRLDAIGARRYEATVHIFQDFLISVVALYRSTRENSENDGGGLQS